MFLHSRARFCIIFALLAGARTGAGPAPGRRTYGSGPAPGRYRKKQHGRLRHSRGYRITHMGEPGALPLTSCMPVVCLYCAHKVRVKTGNPMERTMRALGHFNFCRAGSGCRCRSGCAAAVYSAAGALGALLRSRAPPKRRQLRGTP